MADKRFKLNRRGVREILRSKRVEKDLRRRAEAVAAAAGPGHRVDSGAGRNRARAAIITETFEARYEEAKHRRLTAAIRAARR